MRVLIERLEESKWNSSDYEMKLTADGVQLIDVETGKVAVEIDDFFKPNSQFSYKGLKLAGFNNIGTRSGYRGKGLGRLLIAMLANYCLEKGWVLSAEEGSIDKGKFRRYPRTALATKMHDFWKRYQKVVEMPDPLDPEKTLVLRLYNKKIPLDR